MQKQEVEERDRFQSQTADTEAAERANREKLCDFQKALKLIQTSLASYKGMSVIVNGQDLTVTILPITNGEAHHKIDFVLKQVPCFNESIPEMLTAYLIAQLLKIAEARNAEKMTDDDLGRVCKDIDINFQAKVIVLQQMEEYFA